MLPAYYAEAFRENLATRILPTLESVEELYGQNDDQYCFRNVIVGPAEQCARTWDSWLHQGIFKAGKEKSVGVLRTIYHYGGREFERWALMGAIDVLQSAVYIHEDVYPDRVRNTQIRSLESQADLSPIMLGYNEKIRTKITSKLAELVAGVDPIFDYEIPGGSRAGDEKATSHQFWNLTEGYEALLVFFDAEPLYLLDGHHRYQAAIDAAKQRKNDNRLLSVLTSMGDPDLLIHPFHRIASYEPWINPDNLFHALISVGCTVEEFANVNPLHVEAMLDGLQDNQCFVLPAQVAGLYQITFPSKKSAYYLDQLVVENLENDLFSKVRGISVNPVLTVHSCLEQLASAQAQAAFFLPPLRAEQVREVATQGLRLPRKSTRFYPKPPLGLAARIWE